MIKVYKNIIIVTLYVLFLLFCGTLSAQIFTPTDNIPDFAANPTIQSANSGNWFDAATWQQNRVPGADDVVLIERGHAVHYNGINNAPLAVLGVKGTLTFNTTINTRIKVGTILVYRKGRLDIGTLSSPVAPNAKAELIIAGRPLATSQPDPVTGVYDPVQYGTGLIALGEVNMHGDEIPETWLRVSQEPLLGQNTIILESSPLGWSVGDKLILPDTRQLPIVWHHWSEPLVPAELHLEEVEIAGINGNTITLTQPLQYNHLGGRDSSGTIVGLPHVGNLTRNIVIHSENPEGVRGHVMFTERAKVDVRYVAFVDMGRTTADALDNTVIEDGVVTHIGVNQAGRYSVHMHHLMGPVNPDNTGYQYVFVGNAIDKGKKWGIAVHNTHFGVVDNNVIYDVQGASLMAEEGNERENEFTNNFAIKAGTPFTSLHEPRYGGVTGAGRPLKFSDYGYEGSAFWYTGNDNIDTGNVAANAAFAGIMYNARPRGFANNQPLVPNVRGADINDLSLWTDYKQAWAPSVRLSKNNEVYASAVGLWVSFAGIVGKISDYTMWNIRQNGLYSQRNVSAEYENITIVSDPNISNQNWRSTYSRGIDLSAPRYQAGHNIIHNFRVEGFNLGLDLPTFQQPDDPQLGVLPPHITVIENGYLKNFVNVRENSPIGSTKNTLLRDIEFLFSAGPANKHLSENPANIVAVFGGSFSISARTRESHLYIQNYNKQPGDDFEFYFYEQAPDYVMDDVMEDGKFANPNDNCPTVGLTNQQCWDQHRVATLNKIASCSDTSRSEIQGFTCPIEDIQSLNNLLNKIQLNP
ncbi:G8 domain-containing protein [Nitrosomonas sp. Nm51]|uniref:G8 domain-containing protein n=1 Tax=Nitrosomonas sp. Nm51 TaxID=133720 RepID=UPI0008CA8638|nr:G8 domain-containing protein [Nitrosomonas sp. Nm51]SER29736.1 G8 domain-containing protein [Nitrosomonas sp. Nm51]